MEALILENNLIKSLKPRYNVLLRDDKSYPYIHLSDDQFRETGFHRGSRTGGGALFRALPSAGAVRETLRLMQKLFSGAAVRGEFLSQSFKALFAVPDKTLHRSCVDLVERSEYYASDVHAATLFLRGDQPGNR